MKRTRIGAAILILTMLGVGCAAIEQFVALRKVDFNLDGVSGLSVAGVDMKGVRSYEDIGFLNLARIASASGTRSLPVAFQLHVMAENPADNSVAARLVGLDWTLLLDDMETVSGSLDDDIVLEPGQPRDIGMSIQLDPIDFFDGNARELGELALALAN